MKKNITLTLLVVVPLVSALSLEAMEAPRGRRAPTAQDVRSRDQIQRDFIGLQTAVGIRTPGTTIGRMRRVAGRQGTQAEFNTARSALNALLAKPRLTDDDASQIIDNIAAFKLLNPARWPQPEDYQALFDLKLKRQ